MNAPKKMIRGFSSRLICLLIFAFTTIIDAQNGVSFAEFGDYHLLNGQVIEDCRIGYRTFGRLNAEKSNAVLFPTWYGGTSEHLIPYLGPEAMLDTARYFVILVDAFGDGVSSSPSNSPTQPGEKFPEFTIRDLVNAQHKLLTEHLGLDHLYAVTGISMGGFQTYQWMVSYPDFFDKAAPIVGTPVMTSYDLLVFDLYRGVLEQCLADDCPEVTALGLMLEYLCGFTPEYRLAETSRETYPELLKGIREEAGKYRLRDLVSQLKAILTQDVTAEYDGSLKAAAERFTGEVLIIVAARDYFVYPAPSRELAALTGARLLELDTDCGHYAFACEKERIGEAVRDFLQNRKTE